MAMPGGQEQNMGPNIASVQSLLESTRERSAEDHQEDDKSALAIMCAVTATASEAFKADCVSSLTGGIERAVTTLGGNLTTQVSIFGPSKGVSLAFGFPILIESMQGADMGDGGDIAASIGDGDEMLNQMEGYQHGMQDPWDFDQYPHTDESIAYAARGMEGMSYPEEGEERMYHHHYSPSPSPAHEHMEHDGGMER